MTGSQSDKPTKSSIEDLEKQLVAAGKRRQHQQRLAILGSISVLVVALSLSAAALLGTEGTPSQSAGPRSEPAPVGDPAPRSRNGERTDENGPLPMCPPTGSYAGKAEGRVPDKLPPAKRRQQPKDVVGEGCVETDSGEAAPPGASDP